MFKVVSAASGFKYKLTFSLFFFLIYLWVWSWSPPNQDSGMRPSRGGGSLGQGARGRVILSLRE